VGSGGASGTGGVAGSAGRDGGSGGAMDAPTDSPPASCPAVASTWVGDYEITRLVIRSVTFMDGLPTYRTVTYTKAGTRNQDGVIGAIKESHVSIMADGQVSAGYVLTENAATTMTDSANGRWMKEGTSTIVADWEGDTYYRRKFAGTVEGCLLKLVKTFPEDFANAGGSGRTERKEADLLRR
jgi:hypothetical protein